MDKFNHEHYLPKKFLLEEKGEITSFDLLSLYNLRKKQFSSFFFIVIDKENNIILNEKDFFIENSDNISIHSKDNTYLIKEYCTDNKKELIINLEGTTFILEDIAVQKAFSKKTIYSTEKSEFYYFTNHKTKKLFYSDFTFHAKDKLNSYFLTLPNNQFHKNKIIYYLSKETHLVYNSFAIVKEKQLQDDSVEVFHSANSISNLDYQSINEGTISSQINSVIDKEAGNTETYQNISHISLNEKAVINSKPNLQIENKNVVAFHGNSIGGFNPEYVFYLSQRGLNIANIYKILKKSKFESFINKSSISNYINNYYDDK